MVIVRITYPIIESPGKHWYNIAIMNKNSKMVSWITELSDSELMSYPKEKGFTNARIIKMRDKKATSSYQA